jgi:pSer/pThr/pTyr-binding forkhead associated (FHA) protein
MSKSHVLHNRTEAEVLWFQRRQTLQAAALWIGAGGWQAAFAQQRTNIVEMVGDVLINGVRIQRNHMIQTGDVIETGSRSRLVFVVGNASFHVRQNSRLLIDRGDSINAISVMRLLTGAVVSVWGKGIDRRIITPTVTAGIRGTGVYTEVFPDTRSYFCNCYGTVDLSTANAKVTSVADYHESFMAEPHESGDIPLRKVPAFNHTDEEVEFLAQLIKQRTAWQINGKKGSSPAGYGYGGYGG